MPGLEIQHGSVIEFQRGSPARQQDPFVLRLVVPLPVRTRTSMRDNPLKTPTFARRQRIKALALRIQSSLVPQAAFPDMGHDHGIP